MLQKIRLNIIFYNGQKRLCITLVGCWKVVLEGAVDGGDTVDGVGVGEAEPDGSSHVPAGLDPPVGPQLLHQHVGVPGVVVDGVEQLARPLSYPRIPRGKLLLVLEDDELVMGLPKPTNDQLVWLGSSQNVGSLNDVMDVG